MADITLSDKPGILGPSDSDRAEEMLDEIQKVCRKYNAILIHKPDCMVVAFAQPASIQWRAVAQVQVIAPAEYQWRPIERQPRKM